MAPPSIWEFKGKGWLTPPGSNAIYAQSEFHRQRNLPDSAGIGVGRKITSHIRPTRVTLITSAEPITTPYSTAHPKSAAAGRSKQIKPAPTWEKNSHIWHRTLPVRFWPQANPSDLGQHRASHFSPGHHRTRRLRIVAPWAQHACLCALASYPRGGEMATPRDRYFKSRHSPQPPCAFARTQCTGSCLFRFCSAYPKADLGKLRDSLFQFQTITAPVPYIRPHPGR